MEDKLRRQIDREIFQTDMKDRLRDPLGESIYIFFLLKNGVKSPALDNLIDWMNSWVDVIINQRKFSRFIDREVTSALFGYYSLKINRMLRIEVDENKLNELLSSNITDNYYFGNFTYSTLILLSLADQKFKITSFNRILKQIKDSIEDRTIINDAKNLVFVSLLLEKLKEQSSLSKLIDNCIRKVSENDIRFDDRVYYAWVLWNYRKMREKDFPMISNFVENTLKNTLSMLEEEVDESIKEMYGTEVNVSFSKILLATCLDLLISFNKAKIEISPFSYTYIKQKLISLGWEEAWKEFEHGLTAFEEGRMSDCCNNLRMGLIVVWKNICEKLEKSFMPVSPGKTVDIAPLKNCLRKHGFPDDIIGIMERSWSYVSERAHIEKRKEAPSEYEVRFGIQLVFSTVEYLLRFVNQQKP